MTNDPVCNRCGQCCHYYKDGVKHACSKLIRLPSGKYLCRIYKNRLNHVIDHLHDGSFVLCIDRKKHLYNYQGCPFNKEGYPNHEVKKD